MMKKNIIAAAVAVAVAGSAVAEMEFRPYVGAGLSYNKLSYSQEAKNNANGNYKLKQKTPSVDLLAGVKFNEYVAAELGYNFFKDIKMNNNAIKVSINNLTLDVVGSANVAEKVNLLGSVGFGRASLKNTGVKKNKTGLRLGAGAEYKVDENWGARAMVRYQKLGDKVNVKNMMSLGLAGTYSF